MGFRCVGAGGHPWGGAGDVQPVNTQYLVEDLTMKNIYIFIKKKNTKETAELDFLATNMLRQVPFVH